MTRAGDLVFVGGCAGRDVADALDVLDGRLAEAGASMTDVVGLLSFHADARRIDAALQAARAAVGPTPPAWTPVAVAGLEHPGAGVELSAIAHTGAGEKRAVTPDTIAWWRDLPMPAGCRKGDLTVVSGQFGTDADGLVNTPGDHAGQARNALNRVKEIAGLLGAGLDELTEVLAFHQDPRGIEPARALAESEIFRGPLPTWIPAGVPALYRFGMLGQYQAIAAPGLVSVAAEAAGADAAWALVEDRLAGAEVVAVTSLHTDVRDIPRVRDLLGERCPQAWSAAGATGFARLESRHAFRALARRDSAAE